MLPTTVFIEKQKTMIRVQLREQMRRNDWSAETVAKLAGVSASTVRAWLRPHTSKSSRPISDTHAEKLWLAAGIKVQKSLT